MAVSTRRKRQSVGAVGRPWLTGVRPDSDKGEAWRAAVARSYALPLFHEADGLPPLERQFLAKAISRTFRAPGK